MCENIEKYTVRVGGQPVAILNEMLCQKQGITEEQLDDLKALHATLYLVGNSYVRGELTVAEYSAVWTQLQFMLQQTWGFARDARYHRFWDMAGCICPRMDNEDNWPTGIYVQDATCPIHGKKE